MLSYTYFRICLFALLSYSAVVLPTVFDVGTNPTEVGSFFGFDKRSIPMPPDIPRTSQMIHAILTRLHSFVNETNFDHRRFAHEYESLSSNITRGTVLVNRIRSPEHPLAVRMNFAIHMLHIMRAAQQAMDLAEILDGSGPYYCLLYDCSELRVLAMDTLSDRAVLNLSPAQFQERVRRFLRRSAELETEFRGFEFIPLSVRMTSWNDLMHVNRILQLVQYRPLQ